LLGTKRKRRGLIPSGQTTKGIMEIMLLIRLLDVCPKIGEIIIHSHFLRNLNKSGRRRKKHGRNTTREYTQTDE